MNSQKIAQLEKTLQTKFEDPTIKFDDYDMEGFPIFITDKEPDIEYYITNDHVIVKSDGFKIKAVGTVNK